MPSTGPETLPLGSPYPVAVVRGLPNVGAVLIDRTIVVGECPTDEETQARIAEAIAAAKALPRLSLSP